MTSSWRRGIDSRFVGRENLTNEALARKFWQHLPQSDVLEALDVLASEADVSVGLLRAEDALDLLFDPPRTRNPWRWLWYRGHSGDSSFEIGLQLSKRLKKHGTTEVWRDSVKSLDDFVHAWCGVAIKKAP